MVGLCQRLRRLGGCLLVVIVMMVLRSGGGVVSLWRMCWMVEELVTIAPWGLESWIPYRWRLGDGLILLKSGWLGNGGCGGGEGVGGGETWTSGLLTLYL